MGTIIIIINFNFVSKSSCLPSYSPITSIHLLSALPVGLHSSPLFYFFLCSHLHFFILSLGLHLNISVKISSSWSLTSALQFFICKNVRRRFLKNKRKSQRHVCTDEVDISVSERGNDLSATFPSTLRLAHYRLLIGH